MAGVMNRAMPQQDEPEMEGAPDDENTEKVVLAGQKLMYSDKGNATMVEALKAGAQDPAQAIADQTFLLMQTLDQQSGGKIPEDTLIPAALKLMDEVALIGQKSKSLQVSPNTVAQAKQHLVALAIENGIIDPADIEEMMAGMDPAEMQAMVAEQEAVASGGQQLAGGDPGKPPPHVTGGV